MRALLLVAVFIALTQQAPAAAQQGLPRYDVQRNCRAQTSASTKVAQSRAECVRDEDKARAQLERRWSRWAADVRRRCSAESSTGGVQSYVELLTCLQMSSDRKFSQTTGQGSSNAQHR